MLVRNRKRQVPGGSGAHFAIVASRYNDRYVGAMLRAARAALTMSGATAVQVVRVPGAYEIPVVAASLARSNEPPAAILCLGVILRGETTHAAHIGEAVSRALMEIQVQSGVPIIHEVLLLENHEQAVRRCLDRDHNRGTEAAQTALAMAKVMRTMPSRRPPAGGPYHRSDGGTWVQKLGT